MGVLIPDVIEEQLDDLGLDDINLVIDHSLPGDAVSLSELALSALRGEIDLSVGSIFNYIISGLFAEVGALFYLLRYMLIIAILSAFFKAMTTSFSNTGISKLGFYICYVMVITMLFRSFAIALGIMAQMISGITQLLMGSTPIIIALLASGGYVASASAFAPILLFASSFLTVFMDRLLVPLLISCASISLITYLSEEDRLDKLSEFLQKGIGFGLKAVSLVFGTVLGFARISTPIMNNIAIRGTRTAVAAVPVVGQTLSSAIDTVLYYSQALRGAVSVALLLAAVAITIVPIIQVLAFVVVYKLTAALIAPICEERIVKAIDATGNYAALVLGVCVMAAFLFVFIVLSTLSL